MKSSNMHLRSFIVLVAMSLSSVSLAQDKKKPHDHGTDKPHDQVPVAHLLEDADKIAKSIKNIRGLGLKTSMNKGVLTQQALHKIILTRLNQSTTNAQLLNEASVYKALAFMIVSTNYKKLLIDLYTEQLAGFYDQKTKTLNITKGLPASLQRGTMAQEIFHAIQDQHFDLLAIQAPFTNHENSDFQLATSALIEGDATIVMLDFSMYESGTLPQNNIRSIVESQAMSKAVSKMMQGKMTALESILVPNKKQPARSAMARAPRFLRKLLMFPYIGGLQFVIKARQGRTWKDINAIYKKPPVSTEQILHPERYFAGDDPTMVDFQPAINGHAKIYDNVLGEFQMRAALESQLADPLPNKAAPITLNTIEALKGWDGDRIMAFKTKSNQIITIHLSVWDTQTDAKQYYLAQKKSIERRLGPRQKGETDRVGLSSKQIAVKYGQSTCYTYQKTKSAYIEQWGDLVLHIEGLPTQTTEAKTTASAQLRDSIWKTFKRVDFRKVYDQRRKNYKPPTKPSK